MFTADFVKAQLNIVEEDFSIHQLIIEFELSHDLRSYQYITHRALSALK